jgi:hypothetical protein
MNAKDYIEPFGWSVVEEDGDVIIVEVSEETYRRDIEAGLTDEETLKPGRYKFIRGGFLKRHPEMKDKVRRRTEDGG